MVIAQIKQKYIDISNIFNSNIIIVKFVFLNYEKIFNHANTMASSYYIFSK